MSVIEEREQLLRAAIRESDLDDPFDFSSLQGLIRSDRDRQILREETAPKQVVLDLHLGGPGVDGNATSADLLAGFIGRLSVATKAVAKQIAGTSRHSERLLVEGIAPGSVRVVLRIPDDKPEDDVLTHAQAETVDSKALRRVAGLLALASSDEPEPDGSDPLAAAVEGLPIEARDSLRAAARDVLKADWEIDGAVRQWRQPEDRIRVTKRGAEHLRSALSLSVPERTRRTITGTLDGFRRSTGVAYVTPHGEDMRPLAVAVGDPELFHRVATMAAYDDLPVRLTFDEWQAVTADGGVGRVARRLQAIESLGAQDGLPLS